MSGAGLLSADLTQVGEISVSSLPDGPNGELLRESFINTPWPGAAVAEQQCIILDRKLLFQICMVEDISRSKLSQVDEFLMKLNPRKQMVDRVSSAKRTLISAVDVDADESSGAVPRAESGHMYKLTLQDKLGQLFYAINMEPIVTLKGTMLGAKVVLLPGTLFNRGMFMFTAATFKPLFGFIPTWNANKEHKICSYLEKKLANEREVQAAVAGKRVRR